MRVALVQETVDATRGGAETSTLEMAAALRDERCDVTIVARGGGSAVEDEIHDGVTLHRVPVEGTSRSPSAARRPFRITGRIMSGLISSSSTASDSPRSSSRMSSLVSGLAIASS